MMRCSPTPFLLACSVLLGGCQTSPLPFAQPDRAGAEVAAASASPVASSCAGTDAADDAAVAGRLELTVQRLRLVRLRSGLDNESLCARSREERAALAAAVRVPRAGYPDDAARFRQRQLASDDGRVAPDGMERALAARRELERSGTVLKAGRDGWSSLGPGDVGGRVRALVVDPRDPLRMFAGSATGGIFRSVDGGGTWAPVDDFADTLVIGSLAIDPASPDVLYAGTGEYSTRIDGAGLYKSVDGGLSWRLLPGTRPAPGVDTEGWYYVNRIAIHPQDSRRLLVATRRGCYRSNDAGATWQRATPLQPDSLGRSVTTDADFDPHDPRRAICAGLDGGIWLTLDDGVNWNRIDLVSMPDGPTQTGRVELSYAASARNVVYAAVDNNLGEVWRSGDAGLTWTLLSTPQHFRSAGDRSQGNYDNMLWVDPVDANRMVIGGIDVRFSLDGGRSWTASSRAIHADQHQLVHHPRYDGASLREVYVVNDGGVWKTSDPFGTGGTIPRAPWRELNAGLVTTQFYAAAAGIATGSSPDGRLVGGTQDNGTWLSSRAGAWGPLYGGDGGTVAIDPQDRRYVYGEYVRLALFRSYDGGYPQLICSGITEALGDNGYCGADATGEANFIAPFALDPVDPRRLFAGARSLWLTDDARSARPAWRVVKPAVSASAGDTNYVSAIAVGKTGARRFAWVGHDEGELFFTADAAAAQPSWTRADDATMPRRMVLALFVPDGDDGSTVYAAYGGFEAANLWKLQVSQSGAIARTPLAAGLPAAPVHAVTHHPQDPQYLFVGTEVGVFASRRGRPNEWSTSAEGPASVSTRALAWYAPTQLVAATYGRGFFVGDFPVSPAVSSLSPAVEYYNAALDHWFLTRFPDEIAKLDAGAFAGWVRTGKSFKVFTQSDPAVPGLRPVCRLYGNPARGLDSHFYSASARECQDAVTRFGDAWLPETAEAFWIEPPDERTGLCRLGTVPVYRTFNQRRDVNHRYTTDLTVRQQMLLRGHVAEGYGPDAVAMCSPL